MTTFYFCIMIAMLIFKIPKIIAFIILAVCIANEVKELITEFEVGDFIRMGTIMNLFGCISFNYWYMLR